MMYKCLSAGLALALLSVPVANEAAARPQFRFHAGGFHGGMHHSFAGGHQGFAPRQFRGYGGGRRFGGAAIGAGLAGLAAGAVIGSAIAGSDYGYDDDYAADYGPVPLGGDAVDYCVNRFRSYDPASGTYLGYDGSGIRAHDGTGKHG